MNKRLLSIILAMVLALSLAPTAAVAQEATAEAEGSIEAAASLEEGSEEAALQETLAETQSEEQTESSAEAVISDDTSEIQSGESVESVGSDVSSEVQSGGGTETVTSSESLGANEVTENTSEAVSAGDHEAGSLAESATDPSAVSESESLTESSVDPTAENGEPASQNEAQESSSQDTSTSSAVTDVQALIDALPDADSIDESNMEDVVMQLEAIDDAKFLLSDEEAASLDFTRYDAAVTVLTGDETGLASTPMLTNTEVTSVSTEKGLTDAAAKGGSIQLTGNITLTSTLQISKTVSLDLNGFTISGKNYGIQVQESGGSLTISDSSTAHTGNISCGVAAYGKLEITGGTVFSINLYVNAVCMLYGGTISDGINNYGTFTMTGGTVYKVLENEATFYAGGGTVKGILYNYGKIQGYGSGKTIFEDFKSIYNAGTIADSACVTVNFKDSDENIIKSQKGLLGQATQLGNVGYAEITYYTDPACTQPFDITSANITPGSTLDIYVQYVISTEEGLNYAAENGGSFTLAANIVGEPTIISTVSLNLNGYTISCNDFVVSEVASLTISDSSTAGSGKITGTIINRGNLKITGGSVSAIELPDNAVCTLSGGTISGEVENNGTFYAGGGNVKGYFTNRGTIQGYGTGTTIFEGEIENCYCATISSGSFAGTVVNVSTITGGTYTGTGTVTNNGTISDGTFAGTVMNSGTISDGSFAGTVTNDGTIAGGTYTDTGTVTNNATITDGSFAGTVTNDGTITGGTYTDTGAVINNATITDGSFAGTVTNNGIITDGTYIGTVNNNGIIYATASIKDSINYDKTIGNTITYKIGESKYAQQFVKTNAKAARPTDPTDPTQTGHIFGGWYTDAECKNAFDFDNTTITGDITLYANFREPTHQVTFSITAHGSVSLAAIPVDDSKTATEPAVSVETGYSFGGWYTDENFTTEYDFTTPVIDDITLYAKLTDITAPTGKISIPKSDTGDVSSSADCWQWTTLLSDITFDLFFKDTRTVTIAAEDNSGETVTIEYLTSDKKLNEEELADKVFKEYTAPFDISYDGKYIVYAKLTDTASKITYICSDGIVLDSISPGISDIENGKTYCAAQTVTVADENLDRVTVTASENESVVTLDENNQFKLSPAEDVQTIIAADKAGNKTEITVTVNDGHEWNDTTYEWANDNSSCTATRVCKWDQTHVETETATAVATVTQKQSCTNDELTTYTATFKNTAFGEQKKENVKTADKLDHDFTELRYNETQHWYKCSRCEATDAHADHSGGTATCKDRAICTLCQQPYGSTDSDNHTDTLGEWQSDGTQHWKIYSCCLEKAEIGKHVDDDKNHICDTCGYDKLGVHADANKDHKCDYGCETLIGECADEDHDHLCDYGCGKSFGEHADANKDHKCDYGCETLIGECADEDHDHLCDYGCGKNFGEHADKNNDHNCDYCGEKLSEHTGGAATCKDKAVCDICGEAYGELAPHSLTHVAAKAATTEAEGNKEYWHCSICDKYFSDENAANEIKLADTVIAKLEPETTTEAQKDKQDPPKDKPDEKKDMPKTGDDSNMLLWLVLLLLSAGTISTAAIAGRKRK